MISNSKIIIAIPLLLVGGTEVQTLTQVRALAGAGYRLTVCCYYDHDASMVSAMEEAGARVVLMGFNRSQGNWHLLKELWKFFAKQRPDAVHVQYISPGLIPIVAARLARVPVVFATVHQPGRTYGMKAKFLLRTAARLCDSFFCNSLSVEKSWFGDCTLFDPEQLNHRKHCTIYNAVDAASISRGICEFNRPSLRRELEIADGPVVGVVGRLRWEKGQGVLLEAMAVVARQIPSATLLVVGDGPDRQDLYDLSRELGIAGRVIWLGQQSTEEVYRLYGVMDLAVVPSFFEGFGLAAAEAMAAGLPVIASNVDGLPEVVEDGRTGLLVPSGDAKALADAILTLLGDAALLEVFGHNAMERVSEKFSIETYSHATLASYEQVLL